MDKLAFAEFRRKDLLIIMIKGLLVMVYLQILPIMLKNY